MRQRLDIADVEARTKIRAKYLRALENEEFGMLPGPDVRQDLPAHLRGGARPRPAAAGRGVPRHLRGARRGRAAPAARPPRRRRATARRGAGRGRRAARGCWSCSPWRPCVGVLLVIGLVGGDDDGGGGDGDRAGDRRRPSSETRRPTHRAASSRRAPDARVTLRIVPGERDLRVRRHAAPGTDVRFEGIIERAADLPRASTLRVNLGKTRRAADRERQAPCRSSRAPTRSASSSPRGATRSLPLGERPCA